MYHEGIYPTRKSALIRVRDTWKNKAIRRTCAARGKEDVEAAGEVVQRAEEQERSVPGAVESLRLVEARHGSLLQ